MIRSDHFSVLFFAHALLFAQKKIITIESSVTKSFSATVDRVGELYVITKKGQIQKFDANGKLISVL